MNLGLDLSDDPVHIALGALVSVAAVIALIVGLIVGTAGLPGSLSSGVATGLSSAASSGESGGSDGQGSADDVGNGAGGASTSQKEELVWAKPPETAEIGPVPVGAEIVGADRFDQVAYGEFSAGGDHISFGPRFGEEEFGGVVRDFFAPGDEPATLRNFSHSFDCNSNTSLMWLEGERVRIDGTIATKIGCPLNLFDISMRSVIMGDDVHLYTHEGYLYMGTAERAVKFGR